MEGFSRYEFGGLVFEGAYAWRGLFSGFYGMLLSTYDPKFVTKWNKNRN